MTSETPLAALPVRQRGTLEIVDTALKLYRRYFGVLMGWSAIVALILIVGSVASVGMLFAYPLGVGSCACAVAAAVRGQRITFAQVWDFTKPRYGALLLITFLSFLLLMVAVIVASLLSVLLTVAGAWLLSAIGAPDSVTAGVGIVGFFVALAIGSILSVLAYAWLGLVPIIVCLEDDNRGVAALGRAWELMKGSWGRVLGLSTLLTIAIAAVMGIVGGALALFGQGLDAFSSDAPETLIGLSLGIFGFFSLFFLFWNPIQTLILAVLYLDLRVRKEALDLEWGSYNSAPLPVENSAPQMAPTPASQLAPPPFAAHPFDNAAESPASMSPTVGIAPVENSAPPSLRPPAPAPQQNAQESAEPVSLLKPPTAPDAFDFSTSFSAGAPINTPDDGASGSQNPSASA